MTCAPRSRSTSDGEAARTTACVPQSLKDKVLSLAHRRKGLNHTHDSTAALVGLGSATLQRWLKEEREAKFSPVRLPAYQVRPAILPPAPSCTTKFTVESPKGIKVHGLSFEQVKELMGFERVPELMG